MDLKQMKKISYIWGFLLVLLVVGLTIIGFIYKNKSSDYKKLEDQLVESAKKYVDAKFLYPDDKASMKISFEDMKNDGFIEELKKDDENVCDGYVLVSNNGMVFQYKGFVKCPKYTTKDYEK